MNKYSSNNKCTREESITFRDKVLDFLKAEKLPYKKVYTSKKYGGECRVYTGRSIENMPRRRSKKIIVYKNTKGEWEGEQDYLDDKEWMATYAKGDFVYIKDYHSKQVPQYFSVYREDEWAEEKEELKEWLIKQEQFRKAREATA